MMTNTAFAGNLCKIFIEDERVRRIMADLRWDVLVMWEFLFQMETGREIDKDDVIQLFERGDPFHMIRTDWQEDLELVLGLIQPPPQQREYKMIQTDATASNEGDETSRAAGTFSERFLSKFEMKAAAYGEQNHPKPRTPPPYLPIDFSRLDYDYGDHIDRASIKLAVSQLRRQHNPSTNSQWRHQLL